MHLLIAVLPIIFIFGTYHTNNDLKNNFNI